jgi:hypothetical protein
MNINTFCIDQFHINIRKYLIFWYLHTKHIVQMSQYLIEIEACKE